MELLCTEKDLSSQRRQTRRYAFLFYGLCLFTLIFFVVLCTLVNTANAARMLRLAMISMVLLGWISIVRASVICRSLGRPHTRDAFF